MDKAKYTISWISWPALMTICVSVSAYGFSVGHPIVYFNFAYVFLFASLLFLERWMPHEKQWQEADGQTWANIAHTLSSKGTVQGLMVFSGALGLAELIKPLAEGDHGIWPVHWPMWAQASLGIVAAEFGLYWAHRISHEWPLFWRLHAIHHSVNRLWVINTGRFHFLDSVWKIILGMGVLLSMGAPMEVIEWTSVLTAYIGLLTHCNVEMRFGWLNYIFSTPGVHRWHHSMNLREGDMNYGENVVIWDLLFGSFFLDESRKPPARVGIHSYMPPKFIHQLIWPFLSQRRKDEIENMYKEPGEPQESAAISVAEAA